MLQRVLANFVLRGKVLAQEVERAPPGQAGRLWAIFGPIGLEEPVFATTLYGNGHAGGHVLRLESLLSRSLEHRAPARARTRLLKRAARQPTKLGSQR